MQLAAHAVYKVEAKNRVRGKATHPTPCRLRLLCVSATALADTLPLEHSIRDACSDRYFAQVDVQTCVRQDAERSATAWHNAQAQAIAKMQQWDEEPKYADAALKKYHAAEQAFAAYRNRYCDWAASLGGGAIGTARQMRKNACIAEQNRTHAKQLQQMMNDWTF